MEPYSNVCNRGSHIKRNELHSPYAIPTSCCKHSCCVTISNEATFILLEPKFNFLKSVLLSDIIYVACNLFLQLDILVEYQITNESIQAYQGHHLSKNITV